MVSNNSLLDHEPWPTVPLPELITLQRGFDLPSQNRNAGTIPVIAATGQVGTHDQAPVSAPGVVIGRSGSIGGGQYINEPFWPLNTTLYVRDFKGSNPRFCYYLMKSIDFSRFNAGSGVPTLNRNHLSNLAVPAPPRAAQDAIADMIGALDDKIEHNQRMITTLEETAQVLFQSWFVDFDAVHAKAEDHGSAYAAEIANLFPDRFGDDGLPKGWRECSVLDQADWVNGAAYKNMDFVDSGDGLPVIKIAELKAGVTGQTRFTNTQLGDRYRIKDGELLFSWSGNPETSIDTFIWTGGDAWLNQHIFAVRENGNLSKAVLHTMLKWCKPAFTAIARDKQTTGLGHVTKDDIMRLKLPVGPNALMKAFSKLVEPLFQRQYALTAQMRSYVDLRSTLLPKLISGELRIPSIAREVAAA